MNIVRLDFFQYFIRFRFHPTLRCCITFKEKGVNENTRQLTIKYSTPVQEYCLDP